MTPEPIPKRPLAASMGIGPWFEPSPQQATERVHRKDKINFQFARIPRRKRRGMRALSRFIPAKPFAVSAPVLHFQPTSAFIDRYIEKTESILIFTTLW